VVILLITETELYKTPQLEQIFKLFQGVWSLIRKPSLINNVLNADDRWRQHLNRKYESHSKGLPIISFEEISNKSEELSHFSFLYGGSLLTDIWLLKSLCRKFDNCRYFEIGTWRGESIRNCSEVATECYSLNLSQEEIAQRYHSKKYAEDHFQYSKNVDRIVHLFGDSGTYDFSKIGKKFDVIFIDGSHDHSDIVSDTINVFKYLIHEQSYVVWHDYSYGPDGKLRAEVLSAILDGVPKEYRNNLYHVSHTQCAICIPMGTQYATSANQGYPSINFNTTIMRENRIT